MKFFVAISSLLLTTATAAAIERRQAPEKVYVKVTNLQCQPHGTTCLYTFEVRSAPGSAPLICSAQTQAVGLPPSVPGESCADPNVSFSFIQPGVGKPATLGFTWTSDWAPRGVQKFHASHAFGSGDFAAEPADATGSAQRYVGPAEFVVGGLTTSLVVRQ